MATRASSKVSPGWRLLAAVQAGAPLDQVALVRGDRNPDYMARVTALNGAWLNNAAVQIVLKGNAKDTVVITGIQLVKKCTAPHL